MNSLQKKSKVVLSPVNFFTIPNHITYEIFSMVSESALSRLAQVCHKFNELISDDNLWKDSVKTRNIVLLNGIAKKQVIALYTLYINTITQTCSFTAPLTPINLFDLKLQVDAYISRNLKRSKLILETIIQTTSVIFPLLLEANNHKLNNYALRLAVQYNRNTAIFLLNRGVRPRKSTLLIAAQYSPDFVPIFLDRGVKTTIEILGAVVRYAPEHVDLISKQPGMQNIPAEIAQRVQESAAIERIFDEVKAWRLNFFKK